MPWHVSHQPARVVSNGIATRFPCKCLERFKTYSIDGLMTLLGLCGKLTFKFAKCWHCLIPFERGRGQVVHRSRHARTAEHDRLSTLRNPEHTIVPHEFLGLLALVGIYGTVLPVFLFHRVSPRVPVKGTRSFYHGPGVAATGKIRLCKFPLTHRQSSCASCPRACGGGTSRTAGGSRERRRLKPPGPISRARRARAAKRPPTPFGTLRLAFPNSRKTLAVKLEKLLAVRRSGGLRPHRELQKLKRDFCIAHPDHPLPFFSFASIMFICSFISRFLSFRLVESLKNRSPLTPRLAIRRRLTAGRGGQGRTGGRVSRQLPYDSFSAFTHFRFVSHASNHRRV